MSKVAESAAINSQFSGSLSLKQRPSWPLDPVSKILILTVPPEAAAERGFGLPFLLWFIEMVVSVVLPGGRLRYPESFALLSVVFCLEAEVGLSVGYMVKSICGRVKSGSGFGFHNMFTFFCKNVGVS
ncbi:hypothetical protein l11_20160 [Neisseria weaveri LMG 5135]|nr:hypothetical protein l11_20160 [Neisseria weaveri LMG 5135]